MPSAVRWLLPPPARSPATPLLVGASGHSAELEAMRREGLLVHIVGGVYLPVDVAGSALARAAALEHVVPRSGVVGMVAAAWLRGAPVDPLPIDVLVPTSTGPRPVVDGVHEHWTTIRPVDIVRLGALPITTAARTAADLARCDDDDALVALRWLLAGHVTERQVLRCLRANHRFRNNRRARLVLRRIRDAQR